MNPPDGDAEMTTEQVSGVIDDFTEGMTLADYLEDLRNGRSSQNLLGRLALQLLPQPGRDRTPDRVVTFLRSSEDSRYSALVKDLSGLLEAARRASARAVNTLMTATYWEIGRRIVEFEQGGAKRAEYGAELLEKLSADLTGRFGRGFSRPNLQRFREFYLRFALKEIRSTLSSESRSAVLPQIRSTASSNFEAVSRKSWVTVLAEAFPLPWSHYVLLIGRARSPEALAFYHAEALGGGWSVRQLDRQIASQFYERTALSKNKAAMLTKGSKAKPEDALTADDEVREPLVLESTGGRPGQRRSAEGTQTVAEHSWFAGVVRVVRRLARQGFLEWIERVINYPMREMIQADGRIRRWAPIAEMDGRYLRVVLLADGETVHNAFFDRSFAR